MPVTETLPRLPFPRASALELAPLYAALRAETPVARIVTQAGYEAWLVTDYELAKRLFADPRLIRIHPDDPNQDRKFTTSSSGAHVPADRSHEQTDHANIRRLLAPAFSARRMQRLRHRIGELVEEYIDLLRERPRPLDLHAEFSVPLPVAVICEIVGIPTGDRDRFLPWCDAIGLLDDPAAGVRATNELFAYMMDLVDRKRREPGTDVVSDLIAAESAEGLDATLIARTAAVLLFAGQTTTVGRIDFGTLFLLAEPARYRRLRTHPESVPSAVEEILRMAAPSDNAIHPRHALEPLEVGGVTIEKGELVVIAPAAANRDPNVFDTPDEFDPARNPNPHIAFGHGAHHCIGANLARAELNVVFTELPRRLPGLRLARPAEAVQLYTDKLNGGLTELLVDW
ncbi:cytochrome P450 [Nocardia wallacei]|uniref:cytochrome P450 n=2 Tax=Nocardia TaxID=1817 RepID=UPI002455A54D|nr:cytochrome P450 [Nocardia wallacei]